MNARIRYVGESQSCMVVCAVTQIWKRVDANGDGSVSCDELCQELRGDDQLCDALGLGKTKAYNKSRHLNLEYSSIEDDSQNTSFNKQTQDEEERNNVLKNIFILIIQEFRPNRSSTPKEDCYSEDRIIKKL